MGIRKTKEIIINEEIKDMQEVQDFLKHYEDVPVKYVDRETANSIFGDHDEYKRKMTIFDEHLIGTRVLVLGSRDPRAEDPLLITDFLIE